MDNSITMRLIEIADKKYKIYIDMDGVLTDFAKKMSELMGEPYSEERYESDPKYKKAMWDAMNKHHENGGLAWLELEPMSDMDKLLDYVRDHDAEILSATGKPVYDAAGQKKQWVQQHIGPKMKVNTTRKAEEKKQYAAPNHILIDDKEKAIGPWKKAGGIGILHTSAANTIAELKKLGL